MSYNVAVCRRCGELTYDPDYKRCLNDDCHLAPLSGYLRVVLLVAMSLLMLALAIGNHLLR